MKNVGVWMDKEKALIVEVDDQHSNVAILESEVEDFNPSGGSRSKTKWGPQDVVQDSKYTEREKHQMKRYFENLVNALADVEQLVVFGPADTGKKFDAYLKDHKKALAEKVQDVKKADSMTENQVKALVRDYFNKS